MERICPLLALAADHRTVVGGAIADHRCHAVAPPAPLSRAQQGQLCLTDAYRSCERLAAWRAAHAASLSVPVASDARFVPTRLEIEAEAAWQRWTDGRRWRLAAAIAGVALLAAAGGAVGLSGLAGAPQATPFQGGAGTSPTPAASVTATPQPATPTPAPTPMPTPAATPLPTPPATPAPTPAPPPPVMRYVVQSGDTLSSIAAAFGTSVSAIVAANGLASPDVIAVGQVLIIP